LEGLSLTRSELIRRILEDRLIHEGLLEPSPDRGVNLPPKKRRR